MLCQIQCEIFGGIAAYEKSDNQKLFKMNKECDLDAKEGIRELRFLGKAYVFCNSVIKRKHPELLLRVFAIIRGILHGSMH